MKTVWVHFAMIILSLLALAKRDSEFSLYGLPLPLSKFSESLHWALRKVITSLLIGLSLLVRSMYPMRVLGCGLMYS